MSAIESWLEAGTIATAIALAGALAVHSWARRAYWWTALFAGGIAWAVAAVLIQRAAA